MRLKILIVLSILISLAFIVTATHYAVCTEWVWVPGYTGCMLTIMTNVDNPMECYSAPWSPASEAESLAASCITGFAITKSNATLCTGLNQTFQNNCNTIYNNTISTNATKKQDCLQGISNILQQNCGGTNCTISTQVATTISQNSTSCLNN